MKLPIVAVIGRPNVGKSTFVNRLAGDKQAIVYDQPGILAIALIALHFGKIAIFRSSIREDWYLTTRQNFCLQFANRRWLH